MAGRVERLARAQSDDAANAALDQLGRRVLVDVDARQKVGRNILEAQGTAIIGREDVAAVQFRTDEGQAAHEHAAALGGETRRIAIVVGALQRDARDALQRLGDRTVGQGADVLRGDRIHHLLGIALALGRVLDRTADAGDDHFARSLGRQGLIGGRVGRNLSRPAGGGGRRRVGGGILCPCRCGEHHRHRGDRHALPHSAVNPAGGNTLHRKSPLLAALWDGRSMPTH